MLLLESCFPRSCRRGWAWGAGLLGLMPGVEEPMEPQPQSLATLLSHITACRDQIEQRKAQQQSHRRLLYVTFVCAVPMIALARWAGWSGIGLISMTGTACLFGTLLLNMYATWATHAYGKQLLQQHTQLLRSQHTTSTTRTFEPVVRIFPCTIHPHPHPQPHLLVESDSPVVISRPVGHVHPSSPSSPMCLSVSVSPYHSGHPLASSSRHEERSIYTCTCLCPHCTMDWTTIALAAAIAIIDIWGFALVLITGGLRSPVLSSITFYPIIATSWLSSPRVPVAIGVPTAALVVYCLFHTQELMAANELAKQGEWFMASYAAWMMCMCIMYAVATGVHA